MSLYAQSRWATLNARREAATNLHDRVEVWRPTLSGDSRGGATLLPARVATLPARVEAPTERAQVYAERYGLVASAVVALPFDTVLQPGDELRIGSRRLHYVGDDAGGADAYLLRAIVSELA